MAQEVHINYSQINRSNLFMSVENKQSHNQCIALKEIELKFDRLMGAIHVFV